MSKKVDTWMPLLVDKYLGDTTHLNTEQHGAYLLLLMSMWKKDGRLTDNDQQLAQVSRLSLARWKTFRPVLIDGSLLRAEDGWIVQKRLSAELARSKAHTDAKAAAGAKGAAKKWGKDGGGGGGNGGGSGDAPNGKNGGTAMAQPSSSHWQTGASTPPPIPIPSLTPAATGFPAPPDGATQAAGEPTATVYGLIAGALRRAGVGDASPSGLRFRTLVDAGATADEFLALVPKALEQGDRPFAYLVGAVEGERKRAAKTAQDLHRGPMPAAAPPPEPSWRTEQRERTRALAGFAAVDAPIPHTAVEPEEAFHVLPRIVG